jgi:hypothetical protein
VPFKVAPSINGLSLQDDCSIQSSPTSLQVHSGFALAFESVREQIDQFISTTRRDVNGTTNHTLLFTGKQQTCYFSASTVLLQACLLEKYTTVACQIAMVYRKAHEDMHEADPTS